MPHFRLLPALPQDGFLVRLPYINTGSGWLPKNVPIPDLPFVDKDGNDLGVRLIDVDGRGLVAIVQAYSGDTPQATVKINQARRSDLLQMIDAGNGLTTDVYFQTLIEPSPTEVGTSPMRPEFRWTKVYEATGDPVQYPIVTPVPAMYAVRRAVINEGPERHIPFSYRYGGYRVDALANHSLGFGWREAVNEANGVMTRVELFQDFRMAGRPAHERTCWISPSSKTPVTPLPPNVCGPAGAKGLPSIHPLTSVDTEWKAEEARIGGGALPDRVLRQISLSASASYRYELDGRLIESRNDSFEYDEPTAPNTLLDRRINPLRTTTKWADGFSVEIRNSYDVEDGVRWLLGRLTKSTVTRTAATPVAGKQQPATDTRTAAFTYDRATGLLLSEVANPGTTREVSTLYRRDQYGNVVEKEVHAHGIQDHAPTTIAYDSVGRFVVSETNPLGHTKKQETYTTSGLPRATTNTNGITTFYDYDSFGRLSRQRVATGPDSEVSSTITYIQLSELDPS